MALREPSYFILAALVNGPAHGYGIIQEAAELSGGRVRLGAGTLYGALERLASEGLVEPEREEVVSGRRRRYFRLTGEGESALAEESERMRSAAEVVETRLSGLRSLRSKGVSA
ncbi:MAG TPA: PadR family transcriptional regulator [Thermoleophilaceae bacterium]|jgi:DNA-binding PadR family transcriptional regulator|nr:PadR family transcriptional regulator [Thermoleophilaceae bacterium]